MTCNLFNDHVIAFIWLEIIESNDFDLLFYIIK